MKDKKRVFPFCTILENYRWTVHTSLSLFILHLFLSGVQAQSTTWDDIDDDVMPWVSNASQPSTITHGLNGRHLSVWASHGRYYDQHTLSWEWQRPSLFCTNEDLFTQTIVVPYLIPMLENAGAVVFTPRERDWQRHEVIVDNDMAAPFVSYQEQNYRHTWNYSPGKGFAFHEGDYHDGENPFEAGTARMVETTRSKSKLCTATYQPNLPENGRYAVYVSYQTLENSVDDAHYTVWHKGQKTDFLVNQQMGGSTWVYLGTFDFEKGSSHRNRVVLTNHSSHQGVVTTDAVRFGGGMGNTERGGRTSGLPRCLEGSRYYAQWAGMPYEVYSSKQGNNDYGDDINSRSLMTNLLCGGSAYAPDSVGRHVPIELALAVHSDAGHTDTGTGVYGTLTICTTHFGDSLLAAGKSRCMSRELADLLLNNTTKDLKAVYGEWTKREVYDRNYSESRNPVVPSAILETMSHQNFGDMRYGQDPNFRFTLARSVYKTLLRYISEKHNRSAVVTPLAPTSFRIELDERRGEARLSWTPAEDPQEPSAYPNGYIVYTAMGNDDFDNGVHVTHNSYSLHLRPGVLYSFQVRAANKGGISFPTQTLSALYTPEAKHSVLIVDGFHRLSSPAFCGQGFRLDLDPGVSYGRTCGWLGQQQVFDTSRLGVTDSTGLGFSTDELAGCFIAGNDFNDVRLHAEAIQSAMKYNIVSCSSDAVLQMPLQDFSAIDFMLGLDYDDGHSLVPYRALTTDVQQAMLIATEQGKSLLVSGAYIGTDATTADQQAFLERLLKCRFGGQNQSPSGMVQGLGIEFGYHHQLNEQHYAAHHTDVLLPVGNSAFSAMAYGDKSSAAVAYEGNDYRCLTMGFPFECIKESGKRKAIMQGLMKYLIK